jgi:tetratricopeptide (TPR) repeat protein
MRPSLRLLPAAALAACVHTPPGTSVEVALAKRAELIRLAHVAPAHTGARSSGGSYIRLPAVEPPLPQADNLERIAEATSRADFLMQTGNEPEAIAAYEEAVQIDPALGDVWQMLADLYEKAGHPEKAAEAAKRAKKFVRH